MARKTGKAPPTASRDAPGALSPDDQALWRRVASRIRPLAGRTPPPPVPRPPAPEPKSAPPVAGPRRPPASPLSVPDFPPLAPGAVVGVDRRTADRLRKGRLPVEATLDLHGRSQRQAHAALEAFVAASRAAGRRCVVVVTGKGRGGEAGVLRQQTPRWLNEAGIRPHILAFCQARPQHGGAGALYLLLRRRPPV